MTQTAKVTRKTSLLAGAIRDIGQEEIGISGFIMKDRFSVRIAFTTRGCWLECAHYVTADKVGLIREILYSSRQAGDDYKKVFEIMQRVAEGEVWVTELVRRQGSYAVGQKVRLLK